MLSVKINELVDEVKSNIEKIGKKLKIAEVCGTHTVSIYKNGFHVLFKDYIDFISGPGCPVCVTGEEYIDMLIEIADKKAIYVFGDLMRVPSSTISLSQAKANGRDVRIMYSPVEIVENIDDEKEYVIAAIGFETTIPIFALAIQRVIERKLTNVKFAVQLKLIDNPLKILLNDGLDVDGIILPGHVAAITGTRYFEFLESYKIPSVVSGFEALDILKTIKIISDKLLTKDYSIGNEYSRLVKTNGNERAYELIEKYFEKSDAYFRGIGVLKDSGLTLKKEYKYLEEEISYSNNQKISACRCSDVLTGKIKPYECSLFEKVCTPINPKGACMVSSEGSCAAYYKYGKCY
ncbi:hydrogenase formation protein HypD [Caldicellulosiruptoraceae bacterium PP1]